MLAVAALQWLLSAILKDCDLMVAVIMMASTSVTASLESRQQQPDHRVL
jgi:hypothetical protein